MKKRNIIFYVAVCFMLSMSFVLTACGHEHTFDSSWKYNETHHWHEATCEHSDQQSDYAEHTFGDWETETMATCTNSETEKRTCSVCGYTQTRTGDPVTEHTNNLGKNVYSIVGNEVYVSKLCDACNAPYGTTKVEGAVIVTNTQEAQQAINNSTSNTTICFAEGSYDFVEFKSHKGDDFGNVKLVAVPNVTVKEILINVHQDYAPDNLVIENINFVGDTNGGGVIVYIAINGLNVKGCTFTNNSHITVANYVASNVVIENCKFVNVTNSSGNISAIYLQKTNNVTVKNCEFNVISFNAMQSASSVEGNIVFENNVVNGTGDRALRFGNVATNAVITIKNNSFSACADADNEFLKASNNGGSVVMQNNTYAGVSMQDGTYETTSVVLTNTGAEKQ